MKLADVMDALAARLETLPGLRVYAWPPGTASPPAAIVAYPDEMAYDLTYTGGQDRYTIPVVVLVGRATERTARDALSVYASNGPGGIKDLLEIGPYPAMDTVTVTKATVDIYSLGGVEYLAVIFDLDITG
jgi:hypothetical protein